jgi:hypothetical protein
MRGANSGASGFASMARPKSMHLPALTNLTDRPRRSSGTFCTLVFCRWAPNS